MAIRYAAARASADSPVRNAATRSGAAVFASVVLAAVVLGVAAYYVLGVRASALERVQPQYSPEVLSQKARDVIQRLGPDILRTKGVLAMRGDDDRFVIQAVHMLMEGGHQRPWKDTEQRQSRLVFIGRNLPKDVLREGFEACRA